MGKQILRFKLTTAKKQVVKMPKGSEILSVNPSGDDFLISAIADERDEAVDRTFELIKPNQDIDLGSRNYLGACQWSGTHIIYYFFELL